MSEQDSILISVLGVIVSIASVFLMYLGFSGKMLFNFKKDIRETCAQDAESMLKDQRLDCAEKLHSKMDTIKDQMTGIKSDITETKKDIEVIKKSLNGKA